MYPEAVEFFRKNQIDIHQFDYFDYADFFDNLDEDKLRENPTKRKIKCQQKLEQKQRNKGGWERFLRRMQQQKKYKQEKMQALTFLHQHYDYKSSQILFYPKLNKRQATQADKYWKDTDDFVSEEGTIYKPNQSTFDQ